MESSLLEPTAPAGEDRELPFGPGRWAAVEEGPAVIVAQRVVVLSRNGRLGTLAVQALGDARSLACFESPIDLADWARPPVGVVLMDFPRRDRGIVYRQLRQRYRGPVLALLDSGDEGGGLPEGRGPLATLQRPFSGEE